MGGAKAFPGAQRALQAATVRVRVRAQVWRRQGSERAPLRDHSVRVTTSTLNRRHRPTHAAAGALDARCACIRVSACEFVQTYGDFRPA